LAHKCPAFLFKLYNLDFRSFFWESQTVFLLLAPGQSQFVILSKGSRRFDKPVYFTYIPNKQKRFMMGRLDGKVAIVTGSSRGIGKAIAKLFAAEGAGVVCAARSLQEGDHKFFKGSLTTTVSEIKAAGGTALAVQTDLSKEVDCAQLVARARQALGPVDVLVNNAAVSYFVPIKDMPLKQWDISWAAGPRAIFILTKQVLPDMINRRSGAIVNISSSGAIGPGRGPYKGREPSAYSGTKYGSEKAAIERFSQGLAEELYQYGISVTALSPSQLVVTPGTLYFKMAAGPNDPRAEPPEMMAKAALLLATEPLDKITGRVTYSQAILKEFGWITQAKGVGVDRPGTGYSQI
jgi:citronellol/citronellal dehydrogenase